MFDFCSSVVGGDDRSAQVAGLLLHPEGAEDPGRCDAGIGQTCPGRRREKEGAGRGVACKSTHRTFLEYFFFTVCILLGLN